MPVFPRTLLFLAPWLGPTALTRASRKMQISSSNKISHCGPFRGYAAVLACFWFNQPASTVRAAEPSQPRAPQGSVVIAAESARVTAGNAWLVKIPWGESLHMHGAAEARFALSGMHLAPGYYRLGLIARTGTRWTDANGQIASYRWNLITDRAVPAEPEPFASLDQPGFQPIRESGEPDSWANWYGTVRAVRPCRLVGDEQIAITNRENHGGLIALWVQPVDTLSAAQIELSIDAPNHAFTHGIPPTIHLRLALPDALPALDATLAVEWFDLLSDQITTDRSHILLLPGKTRALTLTPDLKPGVYRVRATLEPKAGLPSVENASSARCLFACAPARLASELSDDWPLGAHVATTIPPLPGFRWYRYFAQWPEINTAPGRYDWTAPDAVFSAVQAAGGRLLIASDGSPTWTSARGKVGMAWSAGATAYPPDDWNVLRDYLAALLARYHDTRGTLAALELCNEANTSDRWRGDSAQMLSMARVFEAAAKTARPPLKIIGLAVSAGDQRGYVSTLAEAGLLRHVNAVSAHFYEELMSPETSTPINNLPLHVDMLSQPMRAAGLDLPMINTECGIGFSPRANDHLPTQKQLNERACADPQFDRGQPWLLGKNWRPVSERRAAATYVGGIVQLMALGVRQSYVFSQLDLIIDGAPSLPWVALGRLGDALHGVDYHQIRALPAHYPGSDKKDGSPKALAYLLGQPGGCQVIIAWGFLSDTRIGRSKHWQCWLDPQPLRIETDLPSGKFSDLYDRRRATILNHNGAFEVSCGEEPLFIQISPADSNPSG
ncbi:MAG: hypothetical protein ABI600_15220 [Luteolibacter sp.]